MLSVSLNKTFLYLFLFSPHKSLSGYTILNIPGFIKSRLPKCISHYNAKVIYFIFNFAKAKHTNHYRVNTIHLRYGLTKEKVAQYIYQSVNSELSSVCLVLSRAARLNPSIIVSWPQQLPHSECYTWEVSVSPVH